MRPVIAQVFVIVVGIMRFRIVVPGAVTRPLDGTGGTEQPIVGLGDDAFEQVQRKVVIPLRPQHLIAAGPLDDAGVVAAALDQLARSLFKIAQEKWHLSRAGNSPEETLATA